MTVRTAQCGCGRVRITVEGEPALTSACHCDFCQKRTGSAFGLQAYFSEAQCIEISGETTVYNGIEVDGVASQAGSAQTPDYNFCTVCGSTVFWTLKGDSAHPLIGIGVGNLVDPHFPAPVREYYTKLRHDWVSPASSAQQFLMFPEGSDRLQELGG